MVPSVGFVYHQPYHDATRVLKWRLSQLSQDLLSKDPGSFPERVEWIYPGPEQVVCFPLEGVNNPQTNWNRPVWEKMDYAPVPVLDQISQ